MCARRPFLCPVKALEIEKGATYIYVVKPDSIVERRYVETGPEFDNSIIIERGLESGENIVVEGFHKLKHGMKVVPVESDSVQVNRDQHEE